MVIEMVMVRGDVVEGSDYKVPSQSYHNNKVYVLLSKSVGAIIIQSKSNIIGSVIVLLRVMQLLL